MTTESPTEAKGRELNERLAERLFPPKERPGWWWFRNTSDDLPDLPAPPGQEPLWAGPNLSGSWEGAGLVLEAMKERATPLNLQTTADLKEWWVGSCDHDYETGRGFAIIHDSAPMAVALAAEQALKSEDA